MNKLAYVDALRGLSIIGVLVVHSSADLSGNFPGAVQNILASGARGVQLFYVVSAFTIFLSYNKRVAFEKHINLNFFIRRFFRIAPMYYVAIIYYLCQNGLTTNNLFGQSVDVDKWNILSNLFFFHGLSPYWMNTIVPIGWSVATEVLFYCIVPLLYSVIRNLNHALLFFVLSLVVCNCLTTYLMSLNFMSDPYKLSLYLFFYFPNQLPVFACGIILFFLINESTEKLKLNSILLLLFSSLIIVDLASGKRLFLSNFSEHVLFSIAFVLLGYALSTKSYFLIVNPVTQYLGKISYSMYLVHMAVIFWMIKFEITFIQNKVEDYTAFSFMIRFVVILIATALISILFYQFIEVPFQKIGKRMIERMRKTESNEKVILA